MMVCCLFVCFFVFVLVVFFVCFFVCLFESGYLFGPYPFLYGSHLSSEFSSQL